LLAREWREQYPFYPEGRYDEDFTWMAAIVLWKRLIPDRICFEQIDDRMQEGYDLLEEQRTAEACDAWWQVWEWLVDKVTPERNTIAALDDAFRGTQSVLNWCQHFEMELGNAGIDDPEYSRLRIRYCQAFLQTFPDVDWLMRGSFLRAETESYWRSGDVETAALRFEALILLNPEWPWGYIDWSDLYWMYRDSAKNYARGEAILRRALRALTWRSETSCSIASGTCIESGSAPNKLTGAKRRPRNVHRGGADGGNDKRKEQDEASRVAERLGRLAVQTKVA
jgi:hypothetical protein